MSVDFEEIEERIKDIISREVGNQRVSVAMVAKALRMKATTYSTAKCRDVVPVKELCGFCAERGISINWMLYDQQPAKIKEETDKYIVKAR